MKNILKISYGFLIALFVLASCESDDNTGYSTIKPTDPTITISNIPASINFIEKDSLFVFNLTMSVAQVVDVAVYAKQIDGDAVVGEDFSIVNDAGKINFPAGSTTAQLKIKILSDNLKESTETFTIQIGDETTANATITPVNVPFTIQNATGNELTLDMTCTTDVKDAIGVDLKPDDVVDLRMLILKKSDLSVVKTIDDDKSSESFEEFSTLADGEYIVAVDIFSTIDVGDINKPVNLSLSLTFNQLGVYNDKAFDFENIMTNEFVCESFRVNLASITKSGASYTFAKDVLVPGNVLSGKWFGVDTEEEYDSQVEVFQGCASMMTGLAFEWMEDFWGEEIVAGGFVEITVDEATKSFTIADQYYMTTLYEGVKYPYTIIGDGTYDDSGKYLKMTVNYELFQDGFSPSQWCVDNGYMTSNIFKAVLTLDPAGLGTKKGNKVRVNLPLKPVR